MKRENYVPEKAEILNVKKENEDIRTFRIRLKKGKALHFKPGQFVEVSVLGVGEAPISMCSCPSEKRFFELSVRKAGNVTSALFDLNKGGTVGIRGPFGNGFPIEKIEGKDVVVVAGGVGFPPLNSVIECLTERREKHGKISLLYGARTPEDLIFTDRINKWRKKDVEHYTTVDKPDRKWEGDVGVVTKLFDKYPIKGQIGVACGPPIMLKFVSRSFSKMGIRDSGIYLSLERLMQCGMGKCGHCNIGNKYVCKDGPIFTLDELKSVTEKVWG